LIALCANACGGDDDDSSGIPSEAVYASDATVAQSTDAAYMYAMTDPFVSPYYAFDVGGPQEQTTAPGDTSDAISTVAANAGMYFTPKDCVDTKIDNEKLTLKLSNCTGPLGIQTTSGTVNAQFSMTGKNMTVDLSSDNLTVNDADVELDATGIYSMSGKKKTVALTSRGSITLNGKKLTRDVTGTITWNTGSKCATIQATGMITVGSADSDLDANYQRCTGECPKSGTVKLTDANDKSTILTFDSTPTPPFSTTDGNSGTVPLRCGG